MATKPPSTSYLALWQAADREEIGLKITVNDDDRRKFVADLYLAREEFGGFDHMMIMQPMPPGTVFIIHETTEVPE
jgi:hypothetical protein